MADAPVHAVHDDDLPAVLEALGLARAFEKGELRCKFCGDVMTWDNLHSLFPDSGEVRLACSKAACASALLRYLDEQRER
jgi:hypothetical protein